VSGKGQAIIDLRRLRVASLVLRQVTQREIVELLPRYKITNPETDQPYSLGTINSDIQHLKAEWQAEARQKAGDHLGRILAEIQEVKREAWGQKDLRAVLAALGEEIDLLGLKNVTVRLETPPPETILPDFGQMEEPALDQLIDNLLALLAPGEA
jgi:hypothetical protein